MQVRKSCIFCGKTDLRTILPEDRIVPQSHTIKDTTEYPHEWIAHNILHCTHCQTYQNKYLADLRTVYQDNHIFRYGSTHTNMTNLFATMIRANERVRNVIEVGGGNGELCELLHKDVDHYYIVDPSYTGSAHANLSVVPSFIEDADIDKYPANTLIMSHVFEHLYTPLDVLYKIRDAPNIQYVYVCHPDFESYVTTSPKTLNCLHVEHTYFVTHEMVIDLFRLIGFKETKQLSDQGYAMYWEFTRDTRDTSSSPVIPSQTIESQIQPREGHSLVDRYISYIHDKVQQYNQIIHETKGKASIYIWPCSIHTVSLFNYGLDYKSLDGVLDNAKTKIGKYVYGYDVVCKGFMDVVTSSNDDVVVLLSGGCFNKEILQNVATNVKFIM